MPEQLVAREHLARIADEGREQLELERGQAHLPVADGDRALAVVDRQITVRVGVRLVAARLARRAPEQRLYAGDELLPSEGLDDVVVRTGLEAPHPLQLVTSGRQHQHGHLAEVSDALERLEPVQVRHRDIEDDEVGPPGVHLAEARPAVRRLADERPRPRQEGLDEAADVGVVVDDEDAGALHTIFIPRTSAVPTAAGDAPPVASILISDPDPETRTLLELLILRLGHRPVGPRDLASGEELELLLLEPASPANLRQARVLRRRLERLPIVCVSVAPQSSEALALRPAAYVMKPFRRSELERAVTEALAPAPYLVEIA